MPSNGGDGLEVANHGLPSSRRPVRSPQMSACSSTRSRTMILFIVRSARARHDKSFRRRPPFSKDWIEDSSADAVRPDCIERNFEQCALLRR